MRPRRGRERGPDPRARDPRPDHRARRAERGVYRPGRRARARRQGWGTTRDSLSRCVLSC
ncbi:hypothetical protein FDM98_08465 [Microbacterium sp. TL13]|nr:hypothetical protein [Microbacterium sp. TL13]